MELRSLGNRGLQVPPISFGGNVFGWTADKKTSYKILDALLERGLNFIDTADGYSRWAPGNKGGESESIIGEWIKERNNRDKLIIATKVGMDIGQGHVDLSPDHILKQIDKSLDRLQTDYVDLYYSHKYDDTTPHQKTLATYNHLIDQGKVRFIGASNFPLGALRTSVAYSEEDKLPRYEVYQPEYHLMHREEFEGDYLEFCLEKNIGVCSYFTLASGFLTGKYKDQSDTEDADREDFVKKYFNERGKRVLDALGKVASRREVSEAAISIAWAINKKGITSPIASASKMDQLKAFDEALHINLDSEDMERLNKASSKITPGLT